jgi:hypothetical protein
MLAMLVLPVLKLPIILPLISPGRLTWMEAERRTRLRPNEIHEMLIGWSI